jgi:hypothetical protein
MASIRLGTVRKRLAWLAVLAMLVHAIGPVYAMAAQPRGDGSAMSACAGMGFAPASGPSDEHKGHKPSHPAVCPYCAVHATAGTLSSPVLVRPVLVSGAIAESRYADDRRPSGRVEISKPIRAPPFGLRRPAARG